jgi:hypothetical protein
MGDQINFGLPIISQAFFGMAFTLEPRPKIILSMFFLPIYALSRNSLFVLFLWCTWLTSHCAKNISFSWMKWSIILHSILKLDSSFISSKQHFRKLFKVLTLSTFLSEWSFTRGISYTSVLSYKGGMFEFDVIHSSPMNSLLSCIYIYLCFLGSNNGRGYVAFLTH